MNWFFDQWYFGSGHPKLNIAYNYNPTSKKVKVTVVQSQPNYFEFPFAVDVVVDGKITRHHVWAAKKKENSYEFDAQKQPEVVIPNADQVLLCDITDNKTTEEFAAQYKYGKGEFITRLFALDKVSNAQSFNEAALNTLMAGLNDPYEGIRVRTINFLDAKDSKVKAKAIPLLKKLASSDSKTIVQAAALSKLNEMEEKDLALFQSGLKSNSYSVQAAAANGVLRLDPSQISTLSNLEEEVISTNPQLIGALLDEWISKNDKSKLKIAAESVAFYLFTKYEDPTLGNQLEKGFNWVLSSDDMASTEIVASNYKQVHKWYAKDNANLTLMLKNLIDQAISLKVKSSQTNPSKGYEAQIKLLNDAKDSMK